jgi:hypothetical protein
VLVTIWPCFAGPELASTFRLPDKELPRRQLSGGQPSAGHHAGSLTALLSRLADWLARHWGGTSGLASLTSEVRLAS